MNKKADKWFFGRRLYLFAEVARELWYATPSTGETHYEVIWLGWSTRLDAPGAKLFSVSILWLRLGVGFNQRPRKDVMQKQPTLPKGFETVGYRQMERNEGHEKTT